MKTFPQFDFAHPDVFGTSAGFTTTPAGRLRLVHGDEAVRQAIVMLLSTRPGERVMRPRYGCDLHHLAFHPNDATTAGMAEHAVRAALRAFEPRIDAVEVRAGPDPEDDEVLRIDLRYRVRTTGRIDSLAWLFHLGVTPR